MTTRQSQAQSQTQSRSHAQSSQKVKQNSSSKDSKTKGKTEKFNEGRWTKEEHQLFVHGLELYGKGNDL